MSYKNSKQNRKYKDIHPADNDQWIKNQRNNSNDSKSCNGTPSNANSSSENNFSEKNYSKNGINSPTNNAKNSQNGSRNGQNHYGNNQNKNKQANINGNKSGPNEIIQQQQSPGNIQSNSNTFNYKQNTQPNSSTNIGASSIRMNSNSGVGMASKVLSSNSESATVAESTSQSNSSQTNHKIFISIQNHITPNNNTTRNKLNVSTPQNNDSDIKNEVINIKERLDNCNYAEGRQKNNIYLREPLDKHQERTNSSTSSHSVITDEGTNKHRGNKKREHGKGNNHNNKKDNPQKKELDFHSKWTKEKLPEKNTSSMSQTSNDNNNNKGYKNYKHEYFKEKINTNEESIPKITQEEKHKEERHKQHFDERHKGNHDDNHRKIEKEKVKWEEKGKGNIETKQLKEKISDQPSNQNVTVSSNNSSISLSNVNTQKPKSNNKFATWDYQEEEEPRQQQQQQKQQSQQHKIDENEQIKESEDTQALIEIQIKGEDVKLTFENEEDLIRIEDKINDLCTNMKLSEQKILELKIKIIDEILVNIYKNHLLLNQDEEIRSILQNKLIDLTEQYSLLMELHFSFYPKYLDGTNEYLQLSSSSSQQVDNQMYQNNSEESPTHNTSHLYNNLNPQQIQYNNFPYPFIHQFYPNPHSLPTSNSQAQIPQGQAYGYGFPPQVFSKQQNSGMMPPFFPPNSQSFAQNQQSTNYYQSNQTNPQFMQNPQLQNPQGYYPNSSHSPYSHNPAQQQSQYVLAQFFPINNMNSNNNIKQQKQQHRD